MHVCGRARYARPVGTHLATIFVDQPIDPFYTRLAYTTFTRLYKGSAY